VTLPPGEREHDAAVQLVRGDLVADRLLGIGQGLADGGAHPLQDRVYFLRLGGKVRVHSFEARLGHVMWSGA
jgi:hypothetical protein